MQSKVYLPHLVFLGCCTSKGLANETVAQIHSTIFKHLLLLTIHVCRLSTQCRARPCLWSPAPNLIALRRSLLPATVGIPRILGHTWGRWDLNIWFSDADEQGFDWMHSSVGEDLKWSSNSMAWPVQPWSQLTREKMNCELCCIYRAKGGKM